VSEAPTGTGVTPAVARSSGISYVHIPAKDPRLAADFYAAVFGWQLGGDPEAPTFEDGTGHVIGRWVTDQEPTGDDGIRLYVYVDSVQATLQKVLIHGGQVGQPPYAEGALTVATFRDPTGNTFGIWQQATV
jgi:predicted enzyme related to lactoylglutathione lyase